jgi:sn-glycerol 3-phosphate transport system substrate-binding protein
VGNYEEGLNKTRTAMLAKRVPHLVQITDIGTQIMVDTGRIVPLQDFTDKDPSFPVDQILPQVRRYYEVGGRWQSLPFATSNPILYYNADLFEKAGIANPPKTFDELFQTARKLTNPSTKSTGLVWPLHSWFLEQFMARQGQPLVAPANGREGRRAVEANFLLPEAIRFVQLWADMVKEGVFSNVGRGWDPAVQNFLAGRSAMLVTSTSDVFDIHQKAPFEVRTAAIPTADEKTVGGTILGGNSVWILKDKPASEQQAAYELVKYLASKDAQRRWHTGTGYFPIRKDVFDELEKEGFYAKYPSARTAIDQMRSSPAIPATSGALLGSFPQLREQVESAVERILTTGQPVAEALGEAKKNAERAFVRYNRGRP